jgi:hypothetical protein
MALPNGTDLNGLLAQLLQGRGGGAAPATGGNLLGYLGGGAGSSGDGGDGSGTGTGTGGGLFGGLGSGSGGLGGGFLGGSGGNVLADLLARLRGDNGSGTSGPGTGAIGDPTATQMVQQSLSSLGIPETVTSGPGYVITAPFRGLYTQGQVDQYGQQTPMTLGSVTPDGKYQTQTYNWWDPNAQPSAPKTQKGNTVKG